MDAERLEIARKSMYEQGIDALVCRLPTNVLMLSGYWPLNGISYLVFPLEGRQSCIVAHCEEVEAGDELWDADIISIPYGVLAAGNYVENVEKALKFVRGKNSWKRVGIESDFESVAPAWNAAETAVPASRRILTATMGELADATGLLAELRIRKTPTEIEKISRANEIAAFGLKTFHESVDTGVSGVELVATVEHAIMSRGSGYRNARRVRGFAQVATGATETAVGYRPMEISTLRKLGRGDLALLELAVVADGFWADRTRVRAAGDATIEQKERFDLIRRAQSAAESSVGPRVKSGEVDEAARSVIRDAGYGEEFVHVTGHGVGFQYHDPAPLILPQGEMVLETGMIHSVEPGLYSLALGGMRLEDNVVVTDSGSEVLGPYEVRL